MVSSMKSINRQSKALDSSKFEFHETEPSWSIPLLLCTSSKIFITRTTHRQAKKVQTRGNYKDFWIRVLHTLGLGKHLWVLLEARKTEIKTTSSLLTLYVRGSARDNVTSHRPVDPCIRVLT